ncbi:MAG: DUF2970 domain-containing protein [Burkholderiales bacterium]|jgi:hypothetical protein|nr:DUF2970 domain-containing protein [Burkholderiales bacterium]
MTEARRSSPFGIAKAVFWSFFGIRKGKDHDADIARLTLPQVLIGGVIGAVLLIASLATLVYFVTH